MFKPVAYTRKCEYPSTHFIAPGMPLEVGHHYDLRKYSGAKVAFHGEACGCGCRRFVAVGDFPSRGREFFASEEDKASVMRRIESENERERKKNMVLFSCGGLCVLAIIGIIAYRYRKSITKKRR